MKLKIGDLICIERKRKNERRNKWERWSNVYIMFSKEKAMRFRSKKPVEIKIQDEIDKGNSIQRVRVNISGVLKYWGIDYNVFHREFFGRVSNESS